MRVVDATVSSTPQPSFRLFLPPIASPIALTVAPRLLSWDHKDHASQTRLTTFLDHLESRLRGAGMPAEPLALKLNVALAPGADLFSSGDLDNYLIPVALRLGGGRIASAWATKFHGSESTIQIETAREAGPEAMAGWHFARATARGSASSKDWKVQIRDQVAAQCEPAPDGPLEMRISFRVGPSRQWNNVWKQSIDALGPILGLTMPSNPFHPLDGRIVRLGLHHTVAPELGFDVELGIWWRAAAGVVGDPSRSDARPEPSARAESAPRPPVAAPQRKPLPTSPPSGSPAAGGSAAGVIVFKNDDAGYVRWIQAHPEGYVVNTTPKFSVKYLKLHRASCRHVSELQGDYSRWTTGDYIKVCSTSRGALEKWARQVAGGALQTGCGCGA